MLRLFECVVVLRCERFAMCQHIADRGIAILDRIQQLCVALLDVAQFGDFVFQRLFEHNDSTVQILEIGRLLIDNLLDRLTISSS